MSAILSVGLVGVSKRQAFVLGRMAAYTGQLVSWDFATNESKLDLFPKDFDINGSRPEPEFAVPGKTKLV